jgi:transglutaminase-like putative cysteine protease
MLYIDAQHPNIQHLANNIKRHHQTTAEQVKAIFYYVRDEILFGFHPEVDALSASEVVAQGRGQCNNKSIVFMALCEALDIPAKLYFSDIDRAIHRGFIPAWAYPLFPKNISHSWVEVYIDGRWYRIDGYINDLRLFYAGRDALLEQGWTTGFSVANPHEANVDFSLEQENYVQMEAVTKTHGEFKNPADYFSSTLYQNRPRGFKRLIAGYVLRVMERRVRSLRDAYRAIPVSVGTSNVSKIKTAHSKAN